MRSVSFVRVEGALVRRPAMMAAAYLAANAATFGGRALSLGAVAASAPFGLQDPALALRMAYMGLRGTSEDRLRVLGEEYAERHLLPALDAVGEDVLAQARSQGRALVLVSAHLDVVVSALAKRVKADVVLCNRMELDGGRATGRLMDPLVLSPAGQELLRIATQHGFDLANAQAYGASGDDAVLLSAVARPCAVRPDATLRRLARQHDWPVLEA